MITWKSQLNAWLILLRKDIEYIPFHYWEFTLRHLIMFPLQAQNPSQNINMHTFVKSLKWHIVNFYFYFYVEPPEYQVKPEILLQSKHLEDSWFLKSHGSVTVTSFQASLVSSQQNILFLINNENVKMDLMISDHLVLLYLTLLNDPISLRKYSSINTHWYLLWYR